MYTFAFLISILDINTLAVLLMYFYVCFLNAFPKKIDLQKFTIISPP